MQVLTDLSRSQCRSNQRAHVPDVPSVHGNSRRFPRRETIEAPREPTGSSLARLLVYVTGWWLHVPSRLDSKFCRMIFGGSWIPEGTCTRKVLIDIEGLIEPPQRFVRTLRNPGERRSEGLPSGTKLIRSVICCELGSRSHEILLVEYLTRTLMPYVKCR